MTRASRLHRLRRGIAEHGVLGVVAYLPLLVTKPGIVAADTKQYLYLDPGRLIREAASIWDPTVAAGTVTHQKIGYLLPQGPFYWLFAEAHVPTWIAQRLWMGTLLFAAGAGVRMLARTLSLAGPGAVVAGLSYELSPYLLQYIQRISAILLPWAGLGWMLTFTVLAVRDGRWRWPAAFAIVVALVGGTNATSLLYVGIGPVFWLVYSAGVTREAPVRRAVATGLKIGILSLATSLWWIAGLQVEGAYGVDVLRYTETLPAIAGTSLASEVLRGLGYWYFYGSGRLGPWLRAAVELEENPWLLATSFALPVLAFVGAVAIRWRERAFFVALVLVGTLLAVGTHPYPSPSALGNVLKSFETSTTAGFALRSSDRATPLVILGTAMLLGAGASALWSRSRRIGAATGLTLALLIGLNAFPLFQGGAIAQDFERPSQIPSYYAAAGRYLDSAGSSTRVLIEPGEDFAAYSWGNTIDSVWPAVMTRPELQREQLIRGSYPTADLLNAFDLTLQQGTYEPATLAPIARLFSAGDVVLQSNLAFWRYDTPRPQATWSLFNPPPKGIGAPKSFGPHVLNVAPVGLRLIDEQALALPADAAVPPAIAVFPVSGARPILRTEPAASPLVVDGSGAGLVSAAATGLLADNPTIFYAGSLAGDSTLAREVLTPGAQLLLTDTNRKTLDRWTTLRDNIGETLPATPVPSVPDPTAQALVLFAHSRPGSQTVADYSDAAYVAASTYGNPVAFTPEDRPAMAFDGNLATAWSVAAFSRASGNWLQIALKQPTTVHHLDLVQNLEGTPNRWITKVTLTFDGTRSVREVLTAASRTATGQTIDLGTTRFQTLRITIDSTTWSGRRSYAGATGVGFTEVRIPGVNVTESIQLPTDLLSMLGRASLSHRLTILLTRDRVAPIPPRSDPELAIVRSFDLPTARSFAISGTARISALIPDNAIDTILGGSGVFGGAVIGSNRRLPGDLNARAVFAFDSNPKTFWSPGFETSAQIGAWAQVALTHPVSFDHLDLKVIADGRHSVPTEIRITTDTGGDVLVRVPPVADRKAIDSVVNVPVSFPTLTGRVLRFTIEAIRPVTTINWYSRAPITMPVGIAEFGVPGVRFTPEATSKPIPSLCRGDLLKIDGRPVFVSISGSVGAAEQLQGLRISGCGPDAHGIRLAAGTHLLSATWGKLTGFDLDRLVLDSAPGGAPLAPLTGGDVPPTPGPLAPSPGAPPAPVVRVLSSSSTSARLEVSGTRSPTWLVLGQSINSGWTASIDGGRSLGAPVLIDGYANGWYLPPSTGASSIITLQFAPQHTVTVAIVASGLALVVCLALALAPVERVRRRRRGRRGAEDHHGPRKGLHARGPEAIVGDPAPDGTAHVPPARAGPTSPVLRSGAPAPAHRPSWAAIVVIPIMSGLLSLAVLPPAWAGTVAGGAAVVSLAAVLVVGLRPFVGALGVAALATAGALTVVGQVSGRYPPGDSWPHNFEASGIFALVALVLLVINEALSSIDGVGSRARRQGTDQAGPGGAEGLAERPGRSGRSGMDQEAVLDPITDEAPSDDSIPAERARMQAPPSSPARSPPR